MHGHHYGHRSGNEGIGILIVVGLVTGLILVYLAYLVLVPVLREYGAAGRALWGMVRRG